MVSMELVSMELVSIGMVSIGMVSIEIVPIEIVPIELYNLLKSLHIYMSSEFLNCYETKAISITTIVA